MSFLPFKEIRIKLITKGNYKTIIQGEFITESDSEYEEKDDIETKYFSDSCSSSEEELDKFHNNKLKTYTSLKSFLKEKGINCSLICIPHLSVFHLETSGDRRSEIRDLISTDFYTDDMYISNEDF
jgi:hypothetical protein